MVTDLEAVRRSYLPPAGIRVLLLGESPPRSRLPRFFYLANSTLYDASVPVFAVECGFPRDADGFLTRFQDAGWYLDDFFDTPGMKPAMATPTELNAAAARIAALIDEERPQAIAGVLHGIGDMVRDTVAKSSEPETPWRTMRFPHWSDVGAQAEYRRDLQYLIHDVGCGTGEEE